MCGIVGCVMKANIGFTKKPEDIFRELLYVDAVRGNDSTGIIGVEKSDAFHIMKEANPPEWFLPQWDASQIKKDMWSHGKAYIGHNRKKTIGKIEDETAHPFTVDDNFAMVHNGTLYNWNTLAEGVDVDSHALAIVVKPALSGDAPLEELPKVLAKVYGAYACVAYSQEKHKVFLFRNKERPLSIIETDDAWFFGSEGLMVQWVLLRNGYSYPSLKAIPVNEDVLFTFDLNKSTLTQESYEVKKSTPSVITGFTGGTKSHFNNFPVQAKQFRKFRKDLMDSRVRFVPDDLVETDYPLSFEKGETTKLTLYGTTSSVSFTHSIVCEVDVASWKFTKTDEFLNRPWTGLVKEVAKDDKHKQIIIYLDEAKPIATDTEMALAKERASFRKKIRKLNREQLENEIDINASDSRKSHTWEYAVLRAELLFRDKIKSVDDAEQAAKDRGETLFTCYENGKRIHQTLDGNIYYEETTITH